MKLSLTIAGSDPTGGAGLQADLKVFWAFGVYGLSVVTSVTCQNTLGVEDIFPVEPEHLERQLYCLLKDIKPHSLKTGMLYSIDHIIVIENAIKRFGLENLVVDPVTVSSTGVSLLEDNGLDILKERLLPLARIVTPNIYEASLLTGIKIEGIEEVRIAAKKIKSMGPEAVVITGGHLLNNITVDVYYDGEFHLFESQKIPGEFHGTGCHFSAALAASLALEKNPLESVTVAKEFIDKAIQNAIHPGKGMGILTSKNWVSRKSSDFLE